jgi:hypothetical protein
MLCRGRPTNSRTPTAPAAYAGGVAAIARLEGKQPAASSCAPFSVKARRTRAASNWSLIGRRQSAISKALMINTSNPNSSDITTGEVMELRLRKSIFPYEKCVIAHTYNSSVRLNGVQGVAGSNPAVPIL